MGTISNAPLISTVLLNFLNFLLQIVGVIAIIGLLFASVLYLTARGNEKQIDLAKKIIIYSIIGIFISLGAMVIVRTLSNFFG